jgi:hypothetical protein
LTRLYTHYAKITPANLDKNDVAMKQQCDVNQPIEVMYKQIDDAIEFAAAGQSPYTPAQVINTAYQLVFRTGIFADDCKIWKRRAVASKMWPQFKTDFSLAYQEYNDALDIGPSAAGFHAEAFHTHQAETIDAIANLATATAADRSAVTHLTSTNAQLVADIKRITTQLVTALTRIGTLEKKLAGVPDSSGSCSPVPGVRKHYCWTCGYCSKHSSWYCTTPATGHQTRAKAADPMGGSTKNKPT